MSEKYIEILGGLTSRLTVLASLLENDYTDKYNLIWSDDQPGCNCAFEDLFVNDIKFINKKQLNLNDFKIQTYGSPIEIYSYYNNIVPNIESVKNRYDYLIDEDSDYILMDYPINREEEFKYLKYFKNLIRRLIPIEEIQSIIDRYLLQYNSNTYGVYFRGCQNSINSTNEDTNYSKILNRINEILSSNSKDKIFFSTGDEKLLFEVLNINSSRIIYVNEPEYILDCGYSKKGVQRALIEWILLSKTKKSM